MGSTVIQLATTYERMLPEERIVREQTAILVDGTYLWASTSNALGETRVLASDADDGGAATYVAGYPCTGVVVR